MIHYTFNINNKTIDRSQIKDGDIVAFETDYGRGVALMENGNWFYSAYNLYKRDRVWDNDEMPDDIPLLPPTKKDILLAIGRLTLPKENEDNYDLAFLSDIIRDTDENIKQLVDDYNNIHEHITKRLMKLLKKERQSSSLLNEKFDKITKGLNERIVKLEKTIEEKDAQIEELKKSPTEDAFVKRLVKEAKNLYKHEKEKIEVIRQILYKLGRSDAEAELDAWIEAKEKPSLSVAGDYVANKHVDNEVNGVASGATGISVNK